MANKDSLKFCERLRSLAVEGLPKVLEPRDRKYREFVNCFLIKAISSLERVILLCRESLGDDAGNILRSLFEMGVLMKWVEQSQDDRAERFFDWYLKEAIDNNAALGHPSPPQVNQLWKKKLSKFQFKNRKGQTKTVQAWFHSQKINNLRSLAESVGAARHYDDLYRVLSQIEHPSPSAFAPIFGRTKGNNTEDYFVSSEDLTDEVLTMAFQYFYIILSTWNGEFQGVDEEVLHRLNSDARQHFEDLRKKSSGQS